MIFLANATSNAMNTLDVIFFFGVPSKFDLYYLVHFSHCRIPQVAHDHREKEHKDSDRMISAACAARICSTDLKLFSIRQRFLYSSGTSLMVRFMYRRYTFVAYVRYSRLLLPFFFLRRFFITGQNLDVAPSPDLISYLDIAFLLPL